ncbi:serine/threonine-protein kinase [Nocardioides limicola]|uniref:serine/threonine-protein kinase n=1 Tax=Nocardioides limicola TaxID=2803368 RepID=UPI00193BCC7C|nr:serine/threonine-protein kinase [Nocardioides sp. DJM-14]
MDAPRVGESFGAYRITRLLGRGGMGVVYAAVQETLGREVALKLLNPGIAHDQVFVDRFAREAAALARLDSTHVIHVYDHGQVDGQFFIATQLIDGGDLGAALRQYGPMPPTWALQLAAQLAAGLADAHEVGLVHRDIKPANVLLRIRGDEITGYLSDFGIARFGDEYVTMTGSTLGTPAYMAPELHDGAEATPASDLYSLGCLLWATLTGRPPFQGSSEYKVVHAHMTEPVPPFPGDPGLAQHLDPLFATLLAKDPTQRPGSAREVRRQLLALLPLADGVVAPAARKPAGVLPPDTTGHRARIAVVAASVALVLAVTGVASAALWRGLPERSPDPDTSASTPIAPTPTPAPTPAQYQTVPGAVVVPEPRVRVASSEPHIVVVRVMYLSDLPAEAVVTLTPASGPPSTRALTFSEPSGRIRLTDVPGGVASWEVRIGGLEPFVGTVTVPAAPTAPPATPGTTSPSPSPPKSPSPTKAPTHSPPKSPPPCCSGGPDDGSGPIGPTG